MPLETFILIGIVLAMLPVALTDLNNRGDMD
jgi:hypothetical protein